MSRNGKRSPRCQLEPEILEFLDSHSSPATRDGYRRDLEAFERFLRDHRPPSMLKATRSDVDAYLRELEREEKMAATRARHLSAIRSLFDYLQTRAPRGSKPGQLRQGSEAPREAEGSRP